MVRLILFFLEGGGETHYVRGHSVGAADILGHSDGETLCKGGILVGTPLYKGHSDGSTLGATDLWEYSGDTICK